MSVRPSDVGAVFIGLNRVDHWLVVEFSFDRDR